MKLYFVLLGVFLNYTAQATGVTPCQIVGVDKVAYYTIPMPDNSASDGISDKDRGEEKQLLERCIRHYSVCIREAPPRNSNWLSKKLIAPVNKKNFDAVNSRLVFGLLQYTDKATGLLVCAAAINTETNSLPWYGKSWTINGDVITEHELYEEQFDTVMTPKRLYKALLLSHEDIVKYAHESGKN